jgi:hypothetical protein
MGGITGLAKRLGAVAEDEGKQKEQGMKTDLQDR